jgi:hypothetical protein
MCGKQKSSQASDAIGKEIRESMRRITLLLMLMAVALLAASGVAWAVTKTCPPTPTVCNGTSGADVLKSTSKGNDMSGKAGNDTYTNFVRGSTGKDAIFDSAGKDKLMLTAYSKSELLKRAANIDFVTKNGKIDTLVFYLDPRGKHYVAVLGMWDDTRSRAQTPYKPGVGYIEVIQAKDGVLK